MFFLLFKRCCFFLFRLFFLFKDVFYCFFKGVVVFLRWQGSMFEEKDHTHG